MPRFLALVLACVFWVSAAHANWGPVLGPSGRQHNRPQGGWNGEPSGLEQLRIVRETLTIDLRGADGTRPELLSDKEYQFPMALVEVTYQLFNAGPARKIDLVFIGGGSAIDIPNDAEASLDGVPLTLRKAPMKDNRWPIPETTPPTSTSGPLDYFPHAPKNQFEVSVMFPAGASTLRTVYRTPLSGNFYGANPTCVWQFAYILAPARMWGGVDKLDVAVLAPPGWLAACEPALKREGDALVASFNGIPADALAITIQLPPELFREQTSRTKWILGMITAAVIPVVILVSFWIGRFVVGKRARTKFFGCIVGLGILLVFLIWVGISLAVACAWIVVPTEASGVPDMQGSSYSSSPREILIVLAGFSSVIFGFLFGTLFTAIVMNQNRTAQQAYPRKG